MKSTIIFVSLSVIYLSAFGNVIVGLGNTSCSGALVKMNGMPDSSKALVLTAGHCAGIGSFEGKYPAAGECFYDQPVSGHSTIVDQRGLMGGGAAFYNYTKAIFSTMTGSDLALLEVDKTYAEIKAAQPSIQVYTISPEQNIPTDEALNVNGQGGLRHHSCKFGTNAGTVKEGPWIWRDLIKFENNSSCQFQPGTSGSAVLNEKSEVVGIAGTVSGSGPSCTVNNPCEVSSNGITRSGQAGQSYGSRVAGLYTCYNTATHSFDFTQPNCTFKKGREPNKCGVAPASRMSTRAGPSDDGVGIISQGGRP
jgi:hypothetical protein